MHISNDQSIGHVQRPVWDLQHDLEAVNYIFYEGDFWVRSERGRPSCCILSQRAGEWMKMHGCQLLKDAMRFILAESRPNIAFHDSWSICGSDAATTPFSASLAIGRRTSKWLEGTPFGSSLALFLLPGIQDILLVLLLLLLGASSCSTHNTTLSF